MLEETRSLRMLLLAPRNFPQGSFLPIGAASITAAVILQAQWPTCFRMHQHYSCTQFCNQQWCAGLQIVLLILPMDKHWLSCLYGRLTSYYSKILSIVLKLPDYIYLNVKSWSAWNEVQEGLQGNLILSSLEILFSCLLLTMHLALKWTNLTNQNFQKALYKCSAVQP